LTLAALPLFLLSCSGVSPGQEAIAGLERRIAEDPDVKVRAAAARALGHIGNREVIPALEEALAKNDDIAPEILSALGDLGITPTMLKNPESRSVPGWLLRIKEAILGLDIVYVSLWILAVALIVSAYLVVRAWWSKHIRGPVLFWRGLKLSVGISATSYLLLIILYLGAVNIPNSSKAIRQDVADLAAIELARRVKDASSVAWLQEIVADRTRPREFRWRAAQALGAIAEQSSAVVLEEVAEKDTDSRVRATASWAIGNIYAAKPDKRQDHFDDSASSMLQLLTEIIAERPTNGSAYRRRAEIHFEAGRYQDALADYDKAFVLSILERPTIAVSRGDVLMALGRPEEAIREFTICLNLDPSLTMAVQKRGLAYSAIGRNDDARKDLTASLAANPEDPDSLLARGDLFVKIGSIDLAKQDYDHLKRIARTKADMDAVEARLEVINGGTATPGTTVRERIQDLFRPGVSSGGHK
jgi:tetratricopeptide (TPR) repeat protein